MSVYPLVVVLALLLQEGGADSESPGCTSPEMVGAAEQALYQISRYQTQGYVLKLNRLYDVTAEGESLYVMMVDVLETKCFFPSLRVPVCVGRGIGDGPVYGQCQLLVSIEPLFNIFNIHNMVLLKSYTCFLHEVPASSITHECPDCPTPYDLNDPHVKETARITLQKFNEESGLANNFTVENIMKARFQSVIGPSYFVEYTIVKTACLNSTDAAAPGTLLPEDCEFAHRGFCEGSYKVAEDHLEAGLPGSEIQNRKWVDVKCEIFDPQGAAVEAANNTHTGSHHNLEHPDVSASQTGGPRGTVVTRDTVLRPPPTGPSCPGPFMHPIRFDLLKQ